MSAKDVSLAIGEIDDKYITEAISYQCKKGIGKIDWRSWRMAAACFFIAVFLIVSSIFTFSIEARAAVFGWVCEVYETYVSYRFVGNESTGPGTVVYKAAWIPEGYEMLWEPVPGPMVVAGYRNDAGEVLSIDYSLGGIFHIDSEGVAIEDAYVGEIPAKFYGDSDEGDTNFLIWIDEKTGLHFWVSAPLPKEDMIKIAESLELVRFEP